MRRVKSQIKYAGPSKREAKSQKMETDKRKKPENQEGIA
jgi:hypothetical protein